MRGRTTNSLFVVLVLMALLPCTGYSAEQTSEKGINWSGLELSLTPERKKDTLAHVAKLFPLGGGEILHIVDINGDKEPDFILENKFPTEIVHFIISEQQKLKIVFSYAQKMEDIEFRDGKMTAFTIYDAGCCDEWMTKHYRVKVDSSMRPTVETVLLEFQELVQPQRKAITPQPFKTAAKSTTLRSAPILDETKSENHIGVLQGNRLADYPPGTTGVILAEQKDPAGEVWLFVELLVGSDTVLYDVVKNVVKNVVVHEAFPHAKFIVRGWIRK